MRAIVKPTARPGLEMADVPRPSIGPNDVLVQVIKTSICGTDLHIDAWDEWAAATVPAPMVIGHEYMGVVEAVGSEVERIPLGDDSGDGYWIDDDSIAIGTFGGLWTNIDIGLDNLLDLARSQLLRSFTPDECALYRIDPCPTLDELRGG